MNSGFSEIDGRAMRGLFEEAAGDSVVRLDRKGFLTHTSRNFAQLWPSLSGMLVMPHLSDLARTCHREAVNAYVGLALSGRDMRRPLEFPIESLADLPETTWCSLSIRPIEGGASKAAGALGLLRKIAPARPAAREGGGSRIDPVSGLPDRHAFSWTMRRWLAQGQTAMLAVFAIDRIGALRLQYGERAADEMTWGFARFLEAMALTDCEFGQVDRERIAVMVPAVTAKDAQEWVDDVIGTFSALVLSTGSTRLKVTASAGLAELDRSVDHTMRQAEIGLVMARAAGGTQLGRRGYRAPPPGGSAIAVAQGIAPYL